MGVFRECRCQGRLLAETTLIPASRQSCRLALLGRSLQRTPNHNLSPTVSLCLSGLADLGAPAVLRDGACR